MTTTVSRRGNVKSVQTTGTTPGTIARLDAEGIGEYGTYEVHVMARGGAPNPAYFIVRASMLGSTEGTNVVGQSTEVVYRQDEGMNATFNASEQLEVTGVSGQTIDWDTWWEWDIK